MGIGAFEVVGGIVWRDEGVDADFHEFSDGFEALSLSVFDDEFVDVFVDFVIGHLDWVNLLFLVSILALLILKLSQGSILAAHDLEIRDKNARLHLNWLSQIELTPIHDAMVKLYRVLRFLNPFEPVFLNLFNHILTILQILNNMVVFKVRLQTRIIISVYFSNTKWIS